MKDTIFIGDIEIEYERINDIPKINKFSENICDEKLFTVLKKIIENEESKGTNVNTILYTSIKNFLKGDIFIKKDIKKIELNNYFYTYFDILMLKGAVFPVDLLFDRLYYDIDSSFSKEVERYNLNGLFIDYIVKRDIQKDFSKYADWKNIKSNSLTGLTKQFSDDQLNKLIDDKRYSVIKFHSTYLSKIK